MSTDTKQLLLRGMEGLRNPPYPQMTTEDRLLHACLCAYQKHVRMNDSIGQLNQPKK